MKRMNKLNLAILCLWALLLVVALTDGSTGLAQTSAFTYQGKLTEAGNPASGNYDMQFKLFDTPTPGTGIQQGATLTRNPVAVSAGIFTVTLDFSASVFDGTARYLEIGVRPAGNPNPHTILSPRQQITSSPYAIQTLNATQLGGLPANRYVATNANGNAAIGTGTPAHRLALLGGPCWTGDCWGGALELDNASAIAWRANSANVKFGIGRTENGLFFFRTMSPLGTTTNGPTYDFKMDNVGNVGIGNLGISTDLSAAKLNILTGSLAYGFLQSNGTVAVGSYVDSTGGWLGTKSNHPLHFFTNDSAPKMTLDTSGNVGIGLTNLSNARLQVDSGNNTFAIYATGGVGQSGGSYGLPKAMLLIRNNGNSPAAIEKCYNAVSGTSTVPCDIFSISQPGGAGPIYIRFNFRVTDRFFSMTLINASPVPQSFSVVGFDSSDLSGQTVIVLSQAEQDFYLIVF